MPSVSVTSNARGRQGRASRASEAAGRRIDKKLSCSNTSRSSILVFRRANVLRPKLGRVKFLQNQSLTQQWPLDLRVPTERIAPPKDLEMRPKQAKAWVESLPLAQSVDAGRKLLANLCGDQPRQDRPRRPPADPRDLPARGRTCVLRRARRRLRQVAPAAAAEGARGARARARPRRRSSPTATSIASSSRRPASSSPSARRSSCRC